ncbi:MAG: FAD-dependent oxidoreductase [Deltaproteobacteria bacterium]|nr:FAD-dependent oxidoreductase [Deltaproteobacteria bacterium]
MDKKLGVYICSGCDIGESVEVDKLLTVAQGEQKIPVCIKHANLCGAEGVDLIKKDIKEQGVNSVVVAACSPRVHFDTFSFDPTVYVERVNLREHVAWSHVPKEEDTQMLAEDYVRMGIIRAKKANAPKPYIENIHKTVLVIGGGITGMTSAIEATKAGYKVILVEKAPVLGGWMRRWYKQLPQRPPYKELQDADIEKTINEVKKHPDIKLFTSAEIENVSGQPGMFDVSIKQDGKTIVERAGSIIVSTGWKPYDAGKVDGLGFGKYANVVNNVMMEDITVQGKGKIKRPSDNKDVKSIVFVQCVGSRDKNHLPYCSSVCCLTSLKQASYVRNSNPDAKVYIVYKDMRTPGQYENFYKDKQADNGVFLTKGDIAGITENPDKSLEVNIKNTLIGEDIRIKADMVVLATGMVPATDSGILNLQYRQGKELPMLKYGFPDSNFICFPYETQRTAIYAAGCVRQPAESKTCKDDATGAALKAIQALELESIGSAVHPRAGDLSYPIFFMQKCTQCKRCTEECPFGAIDEDEKGSPKPNPNRCRRCGVCMGACPERIVSFENYSVDIVSSMLKSIEVPGEEEEKLRILALACENDAYPAFDIAGINRTILNPNIRIIPVRCLGSVNIVWIADALSRGIDGIMLMGCKYGEDYQCHFIKGSEIANRRMENLKEVLQRLVLEPERVRVMQLEISDYNRLPDIMNDFMAKVTELGPNPYKSF